MSSRNISEYYTLPDHLFLLSFKPFCFLFSCWLSVETGAIWAFVGPGLIIILVSGIRFYVIIGVHSAFSLVASRVFLQYTRTDDVN